MASADRGSLVSIGPGDGFHLAKDSRGGVFPGRAARSEVLPFVRGGRRQVLARQERCEERLEPVIVFLEDRVELVVVASGAADAQPEEDLARDVGDVVEDVGPLPRHVALVVLVGSQPEVAGRDPQLGVVGIELVARELLGQEPIVGFIDVERADHVVAITPGAGPIGVLSVSVGFGVADQIEPVTCPSLTDTGRGEQAVDQSLVGIRPVVGQERIDLIGAGGRPVRSKATRRIRVALSASGAGVRPWSSRPSRMNRSMGLRDQLDHAMNWLDDGSGTTGRRRG